MNPLVTKSIRLIVIVLIGFCVWKLLALPDSDAALREYSCAFGSDYYQKYAILAKNLAEAEHKMRLYDMSSINDVQCNRE